MSKEKLADRADLTQQLIEESEGSLTREMVISAREYASLIPGAYLGRRTKVADLTWQGILAKFAGSK